MAEQTSVRECCVTGHIHEGTPLGKFEIVHGLRTYVSDPKPVAAGAKQDVAIFIADIFGPDLVNTKLVADSWAGQGSGWKVLLPDFFEGDAVDHSHYGAIVPNLKAKQDATIATKASNAAETAAALGPWLVKHRETVVRPLIEKFAQDVRAHPSTGKVISVGFCWGGRFALLLAQPDSPGKVDCAVAYHPSFLTKDDLSPINSTPVAILKGTEDDFFSNDELNEFESILRSNLGDKLLIKRYENAVHGFSVRGDDNEPREKQFKEDGANEGIQFAAKWIGQ